MIGYEFEAYTPFMEAGRYYLLVRGRWFYEFESAEALAPYYLKTVRHGYAVAATYGRDVIFSAPRQTPFALETNKQ